jgi:hypothetical protein
MEELEQIFYNGITSGSVSNLNITKKDTEVEITETHMEGDLEMNTEDLSIC